GHDADAVRAAIRSALDSADKPTLICARTVIGFGAPNKQGKESCHGAPLGKDEVAAARVQLGWSHAPFVVPEAIYAAWDARARGAERESAWNELFAGYRKQFPELAGEFERRLSGALPETFAESAQAWISRLQAEGP